MRTNVRNKATRKSDLILKKLEDRILFDAVLDPGLDPEAANAQAALSGGHESAQSYEQDVATYHDQSEQAADEEQNAATTVREELVIVDTSVENYQQLVDDLLNNSQEERELVVVLLDADADGIEQVSQILAQHNDLDAVHLVSHGDTAAFRLGNAWITADNLETYAGQIASWGEALNGSGDLLLYGCDLAESTEGRDLVDSLAALTGADVAASDDDTGSATRGGDWALEYRHGTLESSVVFSQSLQSNYRGVLAVGPDVQFANANQDVQLGENFTFTVTFDNTGTDVGYGPFVDLIFPVNGMDGAAGTDTADGIDFAGATYLGQPLNFIEMTFPDDGGGTGTIDHPFAVDATGNPMQITGATGDKLVVLELPFGSYSPGQPPADLVVSATTSNLADLGSDLIIQSRSGFRYGSDPLDNPTADPSVVSDATTDVSNPLTGWSEQLAVTPTLMSLTKTYFGPENETATGPNFPHQYRLDVDIADGQTISNLDITDSLPNNIVITSIDSVLVNGAPSLYTDNLSSLTFPGNNLDLIITPTGSVTGTASAADVSVTFTFYVAEFDADGNRVISLTGEDDLAASESWNNARAVGDWTPIDTRDSGGTNNAVADPDSTGPEHILDDKAIAIQKSVAIVSNSGVAGASPGDVLEYTLQFQISDYYTFGDLIIDDTFQDGQLFDFGYGATFDITDANGTVTGSFTVRSITAPDGGETLVVDETQINNADNLGEDGVTPDGSDGSTTLRFDLSQVLVDNLAADGILQGGLTDGATNDGPATGTIRFRTTIQEDYSDTFSSGDRSVDQGDLITNSNLTITGTVRENAEDGLITNVIGTESDNSSASVQIEVATLIKEVYAINGNTVLPTGPSGLTSLTPGDVITYRIEYSLATSDFEDLAITDFLPLPIFDVLDHNADGVVTPADNWTFNIAGSLDALAPASGVIEFGNSDTFYNSNPTDSNIVPTITVDGASNGLMVTFGDYDDPNSLPSTIELYVSITAQDAPTADGLYLTNIVRASEGTTQGTPTVTDQIVQIEVLQPELSITKGIVSSDSLSATFDSPIGPAAITFAAAGTPGAPFSGGVINSSELASQSIDANITGGIDAGDTIRYAIVLENTGNSTRGAYDVQISDSLPAGFSLVAGSVQVVDGAGGNILFTGAEADLFAGGIELNDPGATPDTGDGTDAGAIDGFDATDGRNVVIIFYDAIADSTVEAAQTYTNLATLENYAGLEGGDNHAATMPTDEATVTIENVSTSKSIVSTSESHTTFVSGVERVTIGEIVRYRIQVALPEGTLTNLQIFDVLPGGLTFIDDGSATLALVSDSGSITSSTIVGIGLNQTGNDTDVGTITPTFQMPDDATSRSATVHNDNYVTGGDVYFSLGDVVNSDNDANVEYAVIEFNALVDNNSTASQNDAGDSLYNDVRVRTNGGQIYDMPNASRPRVSIVEPLVQNINKVGDITTGDAGDVVTYTVTFDVASGNSFSDAFDVRMFDALPAGLNFGSISSVLIDGLAAAYTDNSVGDTIDISLAQVSQGEVVTISYTADLDILVNPDQVLTNDAQVTWSSLPGASGTNGAGGNNTGSDLATLNGYNTDNASGETASIVYDTTSGSLHGERDGSNGAGVSPNDYADNDTHSVTVEGVTAFTKTLISSEIDDAFNGLTDVVIGEIVTYRITIGFPEGTTPNSVIVDTLDNGLAFVGQTGATVTDLAITGSTVPVVNANGRTLTWDFGTVTDANLVNNTDGTITLEYEAVVLNVSGNQAGTSLDNAAEFTWNSDPATALNADAVDVTLRESHVEVTKAVEINPPSGDTSGDAGDAIEYTIVIENTSAYDAFDVTFNDVLPTVSGGSSVLLGATFNVVDSMVAGLTNADFTLSGSDLAGYTLSLNGGVDLDLLKSQGARTITISVNGTIAPTVSPNDSYLNTANAQWTSLDNVVGNRSTYTTDDSGERDGTNAADDTHDYTDAGPASFTVNPPVFTKSLFATDQTETSGTDVTIGEKVTYALLVDLPEGITSGLSVVDLLPPGLNYESYSLVTTVAGSGGLLTADFNGTILPGDPAVTGGALDGDDVTFTFGQIDVTVDNDGSNNSFVILLTAAVSDVATNVGYLPGQTTLANTATIDVIGDAFGATNSNQVDVDVVESNLVITKDIDKTEADAGETLTITLTVDNNGLSDAYDVIIQDILAAADYDLSSVNLGSSGITYPADFIASFNSGPGLLEYNGGTIAAGGTATFTFTVDLTTSVAPGATVNNTATITDASTLQGVVLGERNDPDPDGDGSDTDNDSLGIRRNSLAGNVYFDADNDGVFDGGEVGLDNVDVRLQGTDHLGNAVDITIQTLPDGSYLFDNLRPGTYSVTETQPTTAPSGKDYLDGTDTIGTQGGIDVVNDLFFNVGLPTGVETHGTGNNFGELEEAELSGFVWHDADNDGVKDGGEVGIGGVQVTLTGTDDQGAITPISLTTLPDGSYNFAGLRPGQYTITQTQPGFPAPSGRDYADGIDVDGSLANGDATSNDVINSIDVVAADTGTDYNFGEVVESVVSGYVYHDSNNDGNRATETGIQNSTVTLTGTDDLGNAVSLSTMTDINGYYEFANLRPSDASGYTITQTTPAGYLDGVDTIGTPGGVDTVNDVYSSINILSDTAGTENNFGEVLPASIGGTVFNDFDNDGVQDLGETGIQGVTVTLTGTDDLGNAVSLSLSTDANGDYQFANLRPSDATGYTLTETQPVTYNDGIDSDGSLANGDTSVNDVNSSINVVSGDNGTGYNFAERGASIAGTIYVDDSRDGTLDGAETDRISGVVIELWNAAGTVLIDSTTSAVDGTYRFDNLPATDYQIREIHPAQYTSTSADTLNVTLPVTGLTNQNFGEALWDLGNFVWFDADNDGVQDPGEEGLANVDVTLLYAGADNNFATTGDNVTTTTTTAADGSYSFNELFNGEYQVSIDGTDLPSGVTGTFETDDSIPAIDGTSNIAVGGSDRFDVDFGYTGSGTIGDFVFLDVDGDGIQDAEDNGLANITVNILFAGADNVFGNDDDLTFTTVTDANGMYSVTNLPGGDFQITVDLADTDLPGSIVGVTGPQSNSGTVALNLPDGGTNNDVDFGFVGTLTLGDRIWFDGNGDGIQDPSNEPGFGDVDVTLNYAGQNGVFGDADDVILTDTTGSNGNYGFANLADGEYRITYDSADLPASISGTHEVDDSAPAIDGQSNITLSGSNRSDVDFGFNGSGSISDFVFHDVNADGIQDLGEPGLAFIDVDLIFAGQDGLFGTADDFALQTTTDVNGNYNFGSLPDGDYRVDVDSTDPDMPGGLAPLAGAESIAGTANITLDAINGRNQNDVDFGFAGSQTVGDYVWFDANGDGNYDVDEPGFGDVLVTLTYAGQDGIFGNADDVVLTTTSDYATGYYNFDNLSDGEYQVAITTSDLPSGLAQTFETNDGLDTLAHTAEFSISGSNRDDIDFGYIGALTIGDTVYYDANADGIQGPGEPGLANVDVSMNFAGEDGVFGTTDDFSMVTTTDANGFYSFDNLPEGEYELSLDFTNIPTNMNVITEEYDDTGAANDGTATVLLTTAGGDNNNVDFGLTGSQGLGDFVWFDVNGDGIQDSGEPGFGDAQVTLLYAGQDDTFGTTDDVTLQTITDAAGGYNFANLADGQYQVSVNPGDLPSGLSQTAETDDGLNVIPGTAEVSIAGGDRLDVDFGYVGASSISDFVWYDANGDGIQDPGEPGLPNATIILNSAGENGIFGDADDFTLNTTTDQDGLYLFDNLPAGEYRIDVTGEPGGTTLTAETDDGLNLIPGVAEVQLGNTEDQDDVDFGFVGIGSIGNTIYFDQDGNGVQDPGEVGFPGVTVQLDIDFDGDGFFDHTVTTITDGSGNYTFGSLSASDYIITVTPPAGTNQTADPDATPDDASALTLGVGENNILQNFGYQGTGSIGDTVFWDQNADGVHDVNEVGLPGVTVTLEIDLDADGTDDLTLTTVTDATGLYGFNNLPVGDYTVTVTPLAGTTQTFDNDATLDSVSTVTLGSGQADDSHDFGYRGNGAIGDQIFWDVAGDGGVFDPAVDRGLSGVLVTLEIDVNGDTVVDVTRTTVTDIDGNYSFTNLLPGDYTISVDDTTVPGGMGSNPTYDLDAGNDHTANLTLPVNTTNNNLDFGYTGTASIGDHVWLDTDGDGVDDGPASNEPGLANVDVQITWAGNDNAFGSADDQVFLTTTDGNGDYDFTNLATGNYRVDVIESTAPATTNLTTGNDTHDVALAAGQDYNDGDFGFEGTGSIGDFAFFDYDGDGAYNPAIDGVYPNATITLTADVDGDGLVETFTTTTDINGLYSFPGLPEGTYDVTITPPNGTTATFDADGANDNTSQVVLDSLNPSNSDQDFGLRGTGAVGDTIFYDIDGDGVQTGADPGIPGVTVRIDVDLDGDGIADFTTTAVTDQNGNYTFDNIPEGQHTVTVSTPSGSLATTDHDLVPGGDNTNTFTLPAGTTDNDQDFGFDGTGSIGDTIFWDQDADGVHGLDEVGLPGVTVELDIDFNNDGFVDHTLTTITDANGIYNFGDLPAGRYTVRVTQAAGTTQTFDADGLGAGSEHQSVHNLTAGEINTDQDFGYRGNGSIGDTVFFDYSGDGGPLNLTDNDRGMAGVDVTLEIDVDGDSTIDVTRTLTTDASGNYNFENLIAGDYTITVDSGDLPDAMGANPTFNEDGAIDNTTDVTLAVDEIHNTTDFGYHATPDYSITKDDGLTNVVPGQAITYSLLLTNNGTLRGQNVVVTDTFPINILKNVTASAGGIVDMSAGTVTWLLPSVGMGQTINLTINADVIDPLASGITILNNDVSVTDDGFNGVDPDLTDNVDDDIDSVTAQPDYQIIKSNDLVGPAIPGQTFNYFLQVVNNGDQEGTGIVVTDTLPVNILDGSSVVSDDPANVTYDPLTGDIIWNSGSLVGRGGTTTLTVTVTVQDPVDILLTTINNSADVTDDGFNGADPDLSDNTSSTSDGLDAAPDYEIVKTSNLTDTAMVGDSYEYTITVTNIGNQDGTGVVVTDNMPVTVIDRYDVTTDDAANVSYDSTTGQMIWNVGDLDGRGGSATLTVFVTIPYVIEDPLANTIVNTASVTDDGTSGPDPDTSNNSSTRVDGVLVFAFDSFNNQSGLQNDEDPIYGYERGEDARMLRPIPVDPIFSGLAEPGTTLSLKIYDEEGNVIGERQVVADASGNWLANFPNTIIWKDPHRMDVEQTAPIQGSVDEIDGFNMRRYFHPATHHSLYFTERDTVSTVMRNTADETIESMHAANDAPLQVGWRNHLYQLNVSSTNVSSK